MWLEHIHQVQREIMLEIEKENAIRRDARKEEHREAVKKTMKILRDLNLSAEEILTKLMGVYPDDEEMIREIMKAE